MRHLSSFLQSKEEGLPFLPEATSRTDDADSPAQAAAGAEDSARRVKVVSELTHAWALQAEVCPATHSRLLVPEKQQVEKNVKGVSSPHLSSSNHIALQRGMENLLHPEVEGKWLWLPGE